MNKYDKIALCVLIYPFVLALSIVITTGECALLVLTSPYKVAVVLWRKCKEIP